MTSPEPSHGPCIIPELFSHSRLTHALTRTTLLRLFEVTERVPNVEIRDVAPKPSSFHPIKEEVVTRGVSVYGERVLVRSGWDPTTTPEMIWGSGGTGRCRGGDPYPVGEGGPWSTGGSGDE